MASRPVLPVEEDSQSPSEPNQDGSQAEGQRQRQGLPEPPLTVHQKANLARPLLRAIRAGGKSELEQVMAQQFSEELLQILHTETHWHLSLPAILEYPHMALQDPPDELLAPLWNGLRIAELKLAKRRAPTTTQEATGSSS